MRLVFYSDFSIFVAFYLGTIQFKLYLDGTKYNLSNRNLWFLFYGVVLDKKSMSKRYFCGT